MRMCWLILLIVIGTPACWADTPWCQKVMTDEHKSLTYPPIARAARLQGTVLLRVTLSSQGRVVEAREISGQKLLANVAARQAGGWVFQVTSAQAAPCQAVLVFGYQLLVEGVRLSQDESPDTENMLHFRVSAEPVVLADPSPVVTMRHFRWLRWIR